MMKSLQIIVTALIIYSSHALGVNWIITSGTDKAFLYYDSDTLVKNSGIVTVWKKMNIIEKNGQKYSWIFREEIDCKKKLSRTISQIRYTDLDGRGNTLPAAKPDVIWDSNAPGSVGETALTDICKAAEKITDQDSYVTKFKNIFK